MFYFMNQLHLKVNFYFKSLLYFDQQMVLLVQNAASRTLSPLKLLYFTILYSEI